MRLLHPLEAIPQQCGQMSTERLTTYYCYLDDHEDDVLVELHNYPNVDKPTAERILQYLKCVIHNELVRRSFEITAQEIRDLRHRIPEPFGVCDA